MANVKKTDHPSKDETNETATLPELPAADTIPPSSLDAAVKALEEAGGSLRDGLANTLEATRLRLHEAIDNAFDQAVRDLVPIVTKVDEATGAVVMVAITPR